MRIESIYQLLIPLAFIAIWALTSLFNREAQPLPPRSGRPVGPNGPRPSTGRSSEWRPESLSARASGSGPQGPASRLANRHDDGILIIESEPRSPSVAPPPRGGSTPPKRATKNRNAGPTPPRRVEQATPRNLSISLTRPESPPTIQTQVQSESHLLNPLVLPPSPLLTTESDEAAKAQASRALATERESFSSADIRRLVGTSARLREGFILSELLKPPLALRGGVNRPMPRPRTKPS